METGPFTYAWAVVLIAGPIILAIGLIWAKMNNRRSDAEKRRSEEGTRQNHVEQNREERRKDQAKG